MGSDVLTVRNTSGQTYRAATVWWRPRQKAVLVAERSAIPGQWDLDRHLIAAEAAIWQGGLLSLAFRPTMLISYQPEAPQRLNEPTFRELVRSIVECADFSTIAAFEPEEALTRVCAPYRVAPVFGIRLIFTRPRIPHLRLLERPDGRPLPAN